MEQRRMVHCRFRLKGKCTDFVCESPGTGVGVRMTKSRVDLTPKDRRLWTHGNGYPEESGGLSDETDGRTVQVSWSHLRRQGTVVGSRSRSVLTHIFMVTRERDGEVGHPTAVHRKRCD